MSAVGENLPEVVRGELTMLEPMRQDNMLDDFYVEAVGMREYLDKLTRMASQIGHRYPHMNVLEIGKKTLPTRQLKGAKPVRRGNRRRNESHSKTAEQRLLHVSTTFCITPCCR